MRIPDAIATAIVIAALLLAGCVSPQGSPAGHPMTIPAGVLLPSLAPGTPPSAPEEVVIRFFDDVNNRRTGTIALYLFVTGPEPGARQEALDRFEEEWGGLRITNGSARQTMEMPGICALIADDATAEYCRAHVKGSFIVTASYTAAGQPSAGNAGRPATREDTFLVLQTDGGWLLMLP